MKRDTLKILFALTLIGFIFPFFHCKVLGKEFVVVIDPGHGGHDPGAVGKISKEKNINLNVALSLGKKIQQGCKDVKVVYTRKTDIFVPLDKRADIANNAKADLFISIHTNAVAKGKTVRGAETFTLGLARSQSNLEIAKRENSVILIEDDYKQRYAGFNPNSSESYIMFEFIQDKHMEQSVKMARMVQRYFRNTANRIDRGVHQAGFLVLRATTMPSILVELGYISTPEEEKYLNSDAGVEALGSSIYKAFIEYKRAHEKPFAKGNPAPEDKTELNDRVSEDHSVELAESRRQNEQVIRNVESATVSAKPVFKIQFLTATKLLSKNDPRLKGLSPVDYYKEKSLYKYTYGESTNYNEVLRWKKSVERKFKDAFIIAFKDGEKVDVRQAIEEFKRNK